MQSNDGYVIAWMDERNFDIDIFIQQYDAQNHPVGDNQRVNDDHSFSANLLCNVACDSSGNFLVVWTDVRHGGWDYYIYGQLFSADGVRKGINFRLCDTKKHKKYASIAMREDGVFVVSWVEDDEATFYRIFSKEGNPNGSSRRLKTANKDRTGGAKVVFIKDELFLFWQEVSPMTGLWAERFDQTFIQTGATAKITNYSVEGYGPRLAVSDSSYAFVWMGQGSGKRNIYARIFHINNTPLTSEFVINDLNMPENAWDPDVCAQQNNKFIFTWHDARDGSSNVFFKGYNMYGYPTVGESLPVQRPAGVTSLLVSVDSNRKNKMVFAWEDDRNDEYEIYSQVYLNGKKQGANYKVNDDIDSGSSFSPSISQDPHGYIYTLWNMSEKYFFLCRFDLNGHIIARTDIAEFITPSTFIYGPKFDVGASTIVVTWCSEENVYARRFTLEFDPMGSVILVGNNYGDGNYCHVSVNKVDEFVISWRARVNRVYQVAAQRFDSAGNRTGDIIQLDDSPSERSMRAYIKYTQPQLADDGSIVVAWLDGRVKSTMRTYFQRVDKYGSRVGGNISVKDSLDHSRFSMDLFDNNDLVFAWKSYRFGEPSQNDLYIQRYSSIGDKVGTTIKVNESTRSLESSTFPGLSCGRDGTFVVCWEDSCWGDNDILAQLFAADGEKIGPNVRINTDDRPANQTRPVTACVEDKIITVWEDNRIAGKGKGIYANICAFQEPDLLSSAEGKKAVDDFKLNPNFPNPFNLMTAISFSIKIGDTIKLEIFDLNGRQVAELVNGYKLSGAYQIDFDATRLSSGIYFYRLSTSTGSLMSKMTLIK
ncbi:MAG: T9SS C-terminal target domain-containing protein [Calditrichaeota bacterium]|nr:MAG: T9SS C-terminal target domain-containing protein [Calditrichota bacterium]